MSEAKVTLVRLQHVRNDLVFIGAPEGADGARERLLARVQSDVSLQEPFPAEALAAVAAGEPRLGWGGLARRGAGEGGGGGVRGRRRRPSTGPDHSASEKGGRHRRSEQRLDLAGRVRIAAQHPDHVRGRSPPAVFRRRCHLRFRKHTINLQIIPSSSSSFSLTHYVEQSCRENSHLTERVWRGNAQNGVLVTPSHRFGKLNVEKPLSR